MPSLRRVIIATLAVAALTLAAPAAASAMSSWDVAALQVALKAEHLYRGSIDGIAGPQTVGAVRSFQSKHHLTVDGIAGPQTRHALGRRGGPSLGSRVMRRGYRGWDVAALQFLLKKRGFSAGSIDGGFGSHTDSAVRGFQSHARLVVDGLAGPATIGALEHGSKGSGGGSGGGYPSGPVRFLRPVHGPITSGFGWRWGRRHTGIDFGAPYGARVNAGGVGTVIAAGWNSGGYGYLVIVKHRLGFQSWYAHLSRISMHVGQRVAGGVRIGYVGATGHATGPHLHFEVRHDGVPINPMPYLLSRYSKAVAAAQRSPGEVGCERGSHRKRWLEAC